MSKTKDRLTVISGFWFVGFLILASLTNISLFTYISFFGLIGIIISVIKSALQGEWRMTELIDIIVAVFVAIGTIGLAVGIPIWLNKLRKEIRRNK